MKDRLHSLNLVLERVENDFDIVIQFFPNNSEAVQFILTPPQLLHLMRLGQDAMWNCFDLVPRG